MASNQRLRYPAAPQQPATVTYGSVTYEDPYQWLEENSEASVDWQSQQDSIARDYVRDLPHFRPFLDSEIERSKASTRGVMVPIYAGGRWFRSWTPDGEQCMVVEVSDHPINSGRRLVDFNVGHSEEPRKVDGAQPSPDGRKMIFIWSAGGREMENFQVLDVDTGAVLVERIPQVRPTWTAWLPDSSGFYYSAYDPAISATSAQIYLYRLGQAAPTTPEDIELTHPVSMPRLAADKRHMFILADHLNQRPDYIRDAAAGGAWRPFLKGMTHAFRGNIIGENYIALTNEDAPTGRVVSIPLATPTDRNTWRELLPASSNVLVTLLVCGNRYALIDLVDTYSRIRVFSAEGQLEWEIPLPEPGVVNYFAGVFLLYNMLDCAVRGADDEILFVFSSLRTSGALYRANLSHRVIEQLTEPTARLDAVVRDFSVASADGVRVPYRVVARRDLDLSKPQPTILYGYGGFSAAMVPGWSHLGTWIEHGGVLVLTHLRGGGEFGPDWWHQGRLKHKQNTFNDANAIAEDLIRRGLTTPLQLGVHGGSNGGTMAAAVAVQRPDLYRASVPQVPQTDVLARIRDPIAEASSLDYGDPRDAEMSRVLHAWSPYHNVRDGVAYPALFIDSGLNDPRCPPWHARKFAARIQQATASDAPVLLRVRAGAGHGAASKRDEAEQIAEMLAFFADQLGLPLPNGS